jgi:excisionase family DNA binding protein
MLSLERQFYSVEELASITGLSKPTIYREIKRKNIPALSLTGSIRIPKSWIEQQLAIGTGLKES